jgi:RNA polymerase sigma-70 factor (ECF subfamily)
VTVSPVQDEDALLLRALRAGDERAFAALVDMYGPSLLRLAQLYVSSRAVAEEVVQETWLAVLTGIERFEGRSSLKTWLFRILTNKAKTRGQREGRILPFSSLAADGDEDQTAVAVERFARGGAWATPPRGVPEERLLAGEARARVEEAIAALPPNQRAVITLRDVEGLSADEGVQRPRPFRDKSTCTAPPSPGEGAGRARAVPRGSMSATATRDLPCQEIVELVTDYLEGAMDAPLRASFEAHLAGCPHCTHYLEQIGAAIRIAGTIRAENLSPEFRTGLLEAFREFPRG